tara:strand:+ start:3688 stop:5628 length:1941 start_codon:yes stop_codon:yes gene_type:complete
MATELDKLVVRIEADLKDLKKGMQQANNTVKNSTGGMGKSLTRLNSTLNRVAISMAKIGTVAGIAFGALAIRSVIKTGMEIQRLEIRFNNLFGSVEEGNRAFEQLLEYAGTVPFSLGEIQAGSGSLAVVSKDAEHLRDIMEITGNVAVIAGLDFATTASQIQRVFSGGLAAADIFREKGITQIIRDTGMMVDTVEGAGEAFAAVFSGDGKFGKATKEMAVTVEGNISMIGDVLQQFTIAVAEGFFVKFAGGLEEFRDNLNANRENIMKFGKEIGDSMGTAFENIGVAIDGVVIAFKAFIALKIGMFLTGLTAKVVTLRRAMFKLNQTIKANPIFFAVSVIASVVLLKDEFKSLASVIQNFIIDKLEKAKEAYRDFVNFVTGKSAGEIMAEKINQGGNKSFGLSESDRALFLKNTAHLEEKAEEEITKKKEENFKLRAQIAQVEMDRLAEIQAEAFDEEMEQLEKVNGMFADIGKRISTAFGEAVVSGKDFKDSMVDIFQSVLQQVVALIFQLAVIEPMLKRIREAMNSSALAGGSIGQNIFAGLKGLVGLAGGGSVSPNMPYMVGERGPELFVPKSAGNIMNNAQTTSSGGGQSVVIEQNLNFATGVSQTVRAEIMNMLPAIRENTLTAVRDARLRGGTFAKDFGA